MTNMTRRESHDLGSVQFQVIMEIESGAHCETTEQVLFAVPAKMHRLLQWLAKDMYAERNDGV